MQVPFALIEGHPARFSTRRSQHPPYVVRQNSNSNTPPTPQIQNRKLAVNFGELISFLSIGKVSDIRVRGAKKHAIVRRLFTSALVRCDLEDYSATLGINCAIKIAALFGGAIEVVIAVLYY